jgi:hypothetical protein
MSSMANTSRRIDTVSALARYLDGRLRFGVLELISNHHVTQDIEPRVVKVVTQKLREWMNRGIHTHFFNAVAQIMQTKMLAA